MRPFLLVKCNIEDLLKVLKVLKTALKDLKVLKTSKVSEIARNPISRYARSVFFLASKSGGSDLGCKNRLRRNLGGKTWA